MFDTVQEIALYINKFHNLDLFQQGWYQLKITMRWEDSERLSCGTPSRVVQYEAPDASSGDTHGLWRIDDKDNSFLTQPFRIKYARQDVRLCMMVSFSLPRGIYEGISTSAVILKFELLYDSVMENILQRPIDASPAAVHEFRIPPKALVGLHSYCPVHFDTLHAVLVDVSVHVSLLKSSAYRAVAKVPSDSSTAQDVAGNNAHGSNQVASVDKKHVLFVKALLDARSILLEDLQRLSKAIDKNINLAQLTSEMDDTLLGSVPPEHLANGDGEVSGQGKQQNGLEKLNGTVEVLSDVMLRKLSEEELYSIFHLLGTQVLHLWNTFLLFHRDNKTKLLQYLHDSWAIDRRVEWSIWMVYTKVEMPHHYINSRADDSVHHGSQKRVSSLWKLDGDPAQMATMRAELHRRSIAQMRINNRSIQDLYIFRDPMKIPIVIVERVLNAPRRTYSENSYLRHFDFIDSSLVSGVGPEAGSKQTGDNPTQTGRDLKIVVFVHGFQGHHLDLRLVRNQWLLIQPKAEFLMSEANEDKTHGDIREMGQRLAEEVISFVKRKMDKVSRSGNLKNIKLSFVGHSIGNVIIRTALADSMMEPYLRYLYTYISLSGPHLGYLYSSNSLFNSGLWILKKFTGTQCIHQLTLTDDPDLQNTFFYKLCEQKTLENFKHIVLLSSPQDGYVPYHSARIESCQAASHDKSKKSKIFLEMLNNCMDQIRTPSSDSQHRLFMRCDVNFDTSAYGRNLNSFIGRAAHIEFLESDIFARFIMWSFQELFL